MSSKKTAIDIILLVDENMDAHASMPEELALDFSDIDFIAGTRSYRGRRPVALIATLSAAMAAILMDSDIPYFSILAARISTKTVEVRDDNDVVGMTHQYLKMMTEGDYIKYQADVLSDPADPESESVRPTVETVGQLFAGHDDWVFNKVAEA